jgi:hypothetical protein
MFGIAGIARIAGIDPANSGIGKLVWYDAPLNVST